MKKTSSLIMQYALFLGLGLFLIWWSVRGLSAEEKRLLMDSLDQARYILVMPAMVLLILSHYSRALRWRLLMEPMGFQPSRMNTFFAVMLGYFFNLLMPRMGEVMKCTLLARYEKTPVDRLIGTMVAERAVDVICLLITIGATFLLQTELVGAALGPGFRDLANNLQDPSRLMRWLGVLLAVAAAVAGLAWLLKRYAHVSFIAKVRNIALGIWQGLSGIRHLKKRRAFLAHTIFIWAMYLLSIRIGFYAMEPVSHLGIEPSLSILSIGSIAMIVTQGGIGAYQLAVEKVLLLYNIPAVHGLAYGWLLWAFQTVLVLVIGLICLLLLPALNRKKHESV
jgi:hypothetical protein